ncbi:MAG: hypothetical protein M1827_002203 [Pycnora praestabilis]|nr:MAG: hypothetical protein M1827_002203 [Pycnora praestabilis]
MSERRLRRPTYHEIQDSLRCERIHDSATEELNKDSLEERHVLECRTGDSNLVTKHKNDNEKATVLPLPVLSGEASETCISPVPLWAAIKKRHSENEDEYVPITLNFKKPRGRAKQPKSLTSRQNTVESLGNKNVEPNFKPSPFQFQASKWSSIDQSVFHFVSHNMTRSGRSVDETSKYMLLLEAQTRLELQPSLSSVKSTNPLIEIEEGNHPNTGPTQFVSALDTFNGIIPGCDATQRFQDKPSYCLANKKDGSRCRWSMPLGREDNIRQLLAEFAELNIYDNVQECLDKLVAFTLIAVCHNQQDSVIWKLKSLLRADRLGSYPQVVPITSDLHTERDEIIDQRGSALMEHESRLNLAGKEKGKIESPDITSAIKVTYWLREPPRQAIQYLPEYRPYHTSGVCLRSVRELVVEQAKEPLFIKDTGAAGGFQALNEGLDGYMYVYWNRASFGLVKIGCTTKDVDQRLRNWEYHCRHLAEEHYRSPIKIKHVARVEKLIHTEFREYRVFEPYCRGCSRSHIEWFRGLDLGLVIKRMEAWTEWIMKEPYEEKSGRWRLKDGLESELPQTCATPSETNSPKKRNDSIAKESPRRHLRRRRTPGSSQTRSSSIRS